MSSKAALATVVRDRKVRRAVILGFVVVFFFVSPAGWLAVKRACEADGGYTIFATVDAKGYELRDGSTTLCSTCLRDVGGGLFDFVDVNPGDWTNKPVGSAYHRYSVANSDDPECRKLDNTEIRIVKQTTLASDVCIVVSGIETPAEHVYAYSSRSLTSVLGARYFVNEYLIHNQKTGQQLAVFRRYGHIPILFREFTDRSEPYWSCEKEDPPFSPREFRNKVLRNNSRG